MWGHMHREQGTATEHTTPALYCSVKLEDCKPWAMFSQGLLKHKERSFTFRSGRLFVAPCWFCDMARSPAQGAEHRDWNQL